jgi:predicted dehydrogenase
MDPVRVVVVGCGHLGTYHARKLAADPMARLVGVVDVVADKREALGRELGVPAAASLAAVEAADAAVIAAPTSLHLELGSEAVERGWHLLVEKPIAASAAAGRTLADRAQARGRILQVGHVERFNPAIAAALAIADRPRYIQAERLGPFSGRSTDIDVILDLMIHDLDIVAALVPAALTEVRAVGVPVITADVDMASARLAFADGVVAQLSAGRASIEPSRKIRLFTLERYLSIDCGTREVKSVRRLAPEPGSRWPQIVGEPVEVPVGDALALQDHDFVACVAEGRRPRVDGEAGLRALTLAEAVEGAMTVPVPPEHLPAQPRC